MALILADRVRETSTTTGTGALSLAGAVVGYQTFSSAIGNTNTCYYAISNPGVAEWEVGIGTYATSGNTLTRTTILKSSNANAAVNFSAGTKDVFVTYPATKSVYLDASGNASALGTPASGTVTNLTGTASININGTVGATTPAAGAFTTLTSTGNGLISNGVGAITNPAGWTNLFQIRSNNSPAFSLVDTNAGGTSIQQWDIASNAVTFNLYNSTLGSNALTINATTNLISMTSGLAVTGTLSATLDATIYGVTVGRGAGAVSTNTAVGASALAANTSGEDNTAIGYQAGYTNVSGVGGTFLGMSAGYFVTGSYNTAIGRFSGGTQAISAGTNNTSIGNTAGYRLTAGLCNTAIGDSALFNNTTASGSTAVGYQALYTSNRTADVSAYNSAFGYQAGFLLGTGQFNTFIGLQAGYFCSSGVANTFIGVNASGGGAGSSVTGSKNVIIGGYTGSAAPISATGSNYIVLSDGDGNPRAYWNGAAATFNGGLTVTGTLSATGVLANMSSLPANMVFVASSNGVKQSLFVKNDDSVGLYSLGTGTVTCSSGVLGFTSDERIKIDDGNYSGGLNAVLNIMPKYFYYKNFEGNKDETKGRELGFFAQNIQQTCGLEVVHQPEDPDALLGIHDRGVMAVLVSAIQEQQAIITALTTRITALEAK